jgi:hypothetical protein
MSTSTTRRSGTRAYVGVDAAPDEPQFHVRFTPENEPAPEAPANSFRWIGWATLHIGARGVSVAARRRGWMGFHRRERRFFPSADICNVYREGGAVRVELSATPAGRQSFQFWPGDLRSAATIVALLPTANTVEIDAPLSSAAPTTPGRRTRTTVWVLAIAAAAVAGLISAGVAFLRQSEKSLQVAASGTVDLTPAPGIPLQSTPDKIVRDTPTADPEALAGVRDFERIEPQIEGLKTQFVTAFTALQLGAMSQPDFADGLDKWLIPQWRTLSSQIAENAPQRTSVRYGIHENLAAVAAVWQSALRAYASGLREHDNDKNLAAFAQMRRASELNSRAEHGYAILLQPAAADTNDATATSP